MSIHANRSRSRSVLFIALLLMALPLLTGCGSLLFWLDAHRNGDSAVDLGPFQQMAADGSCADIRNRLFLIDDQFVFWDRAGNCADAAYGQTLYGSTPDEVLCLAHDSIAGPRTDCPDGDYQGLFETILDHLDQPDLGLGSEHTVQPVPF